MHRVERRIALVDRLNSQAEQKGLVGALTAEQWKSAVAYFGGCCAYCGVSGRKITVDHFIPQSLGGGTTALNVIPACRECNGRKGTRLLDSCSFVAEYDAARIYAYLAFVRKGGHDR